MSWWLGPLLMTFLCSQFAHAGDVSIERIKNLVADAFRYPAEKLKVVRKDAPNGRLSFGIESTDQTFFQVTIDVAERGNLLRPQFEAQLTAIMEKTSKSAESKSGVRKVLLKDGGYAYIGLGAGGPGGSQSSAIFVLPKFDREVAVGVAASREEPINLQDAPEDYQRLMSDGSPDIYSRITQLAEQVATITDAPTDSQQSGNAQSSAPNIKQTQASGETQKPEVTPMVPSPSSVPPSAAPWSIIIVLIVTATGLLWLLLKRRTK